jgi:hypothetical protein
MPEYNDRFFWKNGEISWSEGEPPTPEEVAHAKNVLAKVIKEFVKDE